MGKMKKRGFLLAVFGIFILVLVFLLTGRGLVSLKREKVGVVEIKGVIESSEEVLKELKAFAEDSTIKAILLRIDSPGGSVGASQEIWREVLRIREKKPVVASLGNVAASGAYYVACGATKILANPGTLTGSIGVVMYFTDLEELMRKIGIKTHVIKSGSYKDTGSPFRGLTLQEKDLLQGLLKVVHEQFVQAISQSRNLPVEKVREIADGRLITGEEALRLKLVDELGSFEDALKVAKDLGGIKGEVELVYPKRKISLLKLLLEGLGKGSLEDLLPRRWGFYYLFEF
jgi:protease-4